jgi:galactonate dehydratase
MVDYHGRFNRALALEVSRRLEPFHLAWLEDLLWRADDPSALAVIAPQPLAGGEEELERRGVWELLSSGHISTLLPDVKHVGGLSEAKRIAELAEVARVWVAPHNPAGPIATRVSAELAATLPNLNHLELAWGEASFRSALLDPPEKIADGFLELPPGPGFGVTLNEAVLAEHSFDPTALGDSTRRDISSNA